MPLDERTAIVQWLASNERSPRTGQRLPHKSITPNYSLRAQIEDYRAAAGLPPLPPWNPSSTEQVETRAAVPGPQAPIGDEQRHELTLRGIAAVLETAPLLLAQVEFGLGVSPGRGVRDPAAVAQLALQNPTANAIIHNSLGTVLEASLVFLRSVTQHAVPEGLPPIVQCVRQGDVSAVEQLILRRQADPMMLLVEGRSLLHVAAFHGHTRVALLLLAKGAYAGAVDARRATPLHMAAFGGHEETVQLLLAKGAPIDMRAQGGAAAVHLAAFCGHRAMVQLLLDSGADVFCTKENGFSLLHIAAQMGALPVVELLLERGGAELVQLSDNAGSTPLHCAVQSSSLPVVQRLVDAGVNLQARTQPVGELAIHVAAWLGKSNVVEYLLDHECSINVQRSDGCTMLHYAAIRDDPTMARLLISRKADVNLVRNDHFTALHTACWFKRPGACYLSMYRMREEGENSMGCCCLLSRKGFSFS